MRGYRIGTWLFLRVLGVCFLSAFVSFGLQAKGLIGENGILPYARLLDAAWDALGPSAVVRLPSLLWLGPGDGALLLLCIAGAIAALLLACDVAPFPCAAFCWAAYLSIASVGGVFLGYQWDALLLETGLLALLVAPMRLWPRGPASASSNARSASGGRDGERGPARDRDPSRLATLALGFLLFRLMFASGFVKLASHDPAWRGLTAMEYHYWSQPLPAWTAWYAAAAPAALHRASVILMLVIELVVPFLLIAGRAGRQIAAALFVFLQLGIAATGNYGFFNLLSIALVLPVLDDSLFLRIPALARRVVPEARPFGIAAALGRVATWNASLVLLALGSLAFLQQLAPVEFPKREARLLDRVRPFDVVHNYGLFAVMTTTRDEIALEGLDAATGEWREYEFRWKPGDVRERPRFAILHMPRLDWQMWFASLGTCESNEWFLAMSARLLEGSPEVRALFANDPFPDAPPVALRSRRWAFRFARDGSDAWWTREERDSFCPDLTLDPDGRLTEFLPE